jgi:hypothetical protein
MSKHYKTDKYLNNLFKDEKALDKIYTDMFKDEDFMNPIELRNKLRIAGISIDDLKNKERYKLVYPLYKTGLDEIEARLVSELADRKGSATALIFLLRSLYKYQAEDDGRFGGGNKVTINVLPLNPLK